ncbi:MAG: hypothetical protein JO007_18340 [Alphaproteobacteria bacterium]|nr:hypothetical protein [Alphaproteobacteria bacterium]
MSVLHWVRAAALALPEPEMSADIDLVNLAEMPHFLKERQTRLLAAVDNGTAADPSAITIAE